MHSIKPGRGPSAMGAFGGVIAVVFGIIWTVAAAGSGAPPVFALFGVVFIVAALGGLVYNLHNATAKNRMSTFDITGDDEESDPISHALGHDQPQSPRQDKPPAADSPRRFDGDFCPYCGHQASRDFDYCPKCGKDI